MNKAPYELVAMPTPRKPKERVVMNYETREEAEDALSWYERTFRPRHGLLSVRKRRR